jgi:N6-adenosine-specific RNA methylase IME4
MIMPSGTYRTVVADPPWQPKMATINGGAPKASPQLHYKTLSVSEIIKLKPNLSPQSHLYIWCVSQHIDWAYDVARAWDCEPVITLTWKKPGLGVGRFQCNTEHILIARRGNRIGNPFGSGGRYVSPTGGTLFEWPRGPHSAKPLEFFQLVERISPGPYLEMYARSPRPGWDVWGDQATGGYML